MQKFAAAALTALFALSAPAFAQEKKDAKKEEKKTEAKKDEKKKQAKGGC
jgi:hypothetical protein